MRLRCAVLGDPIGHSLSPTLHRAGYAALGVDGAYEAFRVPEGALSGFLAGLDDSWRGLSLTMPLKREALGLASVSEVTDLARLVGGANTLLLRPEGHLADNTDVPGAVRALVERVPAYAQRPPETATIWGGGATAAAMIVALHQLGCRKVCIQVRDRERAAETVAVAERLEPALELSVGLLGEAVDTDLLISTIPAQPQESLVDEVRRAEAVFEVIYHPWPTPLVRWAADRPVVGGLDLLVHQATLQFGAFTGVDVGDDQLRTRLVGAMRAAGERVLHDRVANGQGG